MKRKAVKKRDQSHNSSKGRKWYCVSHRGNIELEQRSAVKLHLVRLTQKNLHQSFS